MCNVAQNCATSNLISQKLKQLHLHPFLVEQGCQNHFHRGSHKHYGCPQRALAGWTDLTHVGEDSCSPKLWHGRRWLMFILSINAKSLGDLSIKCLFFFVKYFVVVLQNYSSPAHIQVTISHVTDFMFFSAVKQVKVRVLTFDRHCMFGLQEIWHGEKWSINGGIQILQRKLGVRQSIFFCLWGGGGVYVKPEVLSYEPLKICRCDRAPVTKGDANSLLVAWPDL